MLKFVKCVKCGNEYSIGTDGYESRTYTCPLCGCTVHKFCLDIESIKKVITEGRKLKKYKQMWEEFNHYPHITIKNVRELISELEEKYFPKGETMKIKVCCKQMGVFIKEDYIRFQTLDRKEVVIDTALCKEDEVEIGYCPFCGEKIEIIKK